MPRARRRSGAEITNAHLCAAHHDGSLHAAPKTLAAAPPPLGPRYRSGKEYFGEMRRLVLAEARAQVRERGCAPTSI